MRVACHRVPDLPLAAELRARPELAGLPVAVASGRGPRAELISVSPEAERAGVRRSSSVSHAHAVCGALRVRVASPALERATRAALLDLALSFSPRARLAPRASGPWAGEAAVHLDASGVGSLFRSERSFATALGERARRLGLPGCVAVASSQQLALIAARAPDPDGGPRIVEPGAEAAFLAPLAVDLLDPEDGLAQALTRFGVQRVGDLLALPRRGLASRLGPGVLRLLERVRGECSEAPLGAPASARVVEGVDLEFAIDRLEPLTFALQGLLSRLLARLAARQLACGDLGLRLALDGGGRDIRRIGVAAPTLDLRVLVRLLRHALEDRPPEAPVVGIELEAEGGGRAPGRDQLDLFRPAGPAPAALGRILAEIASLCGDDRVGAPRVVDDHRPEAFGMTAFRPPAGGAAEAAAAPGARLAIRALRPPLPAAVRVVRGLPESVRSAVANGRVTLLAGPWRTTGAWWSREHHYAYDHFDVRTADGVVARLRYDHRRRAWHVDAVYD